MSRKALFLVCATTALSSAACDPDLSGVFSDTSTAQSTAGSAGSGGGGQGGSTSSQGGGGSGGGATTTTTGSMTTTTTTTTGGGCDPSDPSGDQDNDGYTPAQGDCDDCNPEVNPNALEVLGGGDEDCSGKTDDILVPCDEPIAVDTKSPFEAAKAVDLCKQSSGENDWGVSNAVWSLPDGSPVPAANEQAFHFGHGVLANFGDQVPPRGGQRLLALSSGTARTPADPGYQNPQGYSKGYTSAPAPGFPKETSACGGAATGTPNDATVLNVGIRVPSNVHGFSYDFSFYAFDFPAFVCSAYNDTFFAIFEPVLAGQPDGNIAYDELGNPVTLNGANFRACTCQNGPMCMAGNKMYTCSLGNMPLLGNGFGADESNENRGATGWLTTTVPVEPGSNISLRWGIYDAGDGNFESTAILDNWKWITTDGVVYKTEIAQ